MSQAVVSVNAGVLLPVLAPAVGAAAVLVADVAVQSLRRMHYAIALLSLAVGAVATVAGLGMVAGDARQTLCLPGGGQCMYAAGSVASALQLAALLAAAMTLLLSWPDDKEQAGGGTAVIVSLVLAATAGATAVAGARDLGSWLVSLELATLPTVALVALRGARSAISGAVALLTTALVSFGLLALAAALWFTATASGFLSPAAALAVVHDPVRRPILVLAVVVVVAGIGFKLSLVPFHAWTPEAYDGAPLPIAAFLAATSKIACPRSAARRDQGHRADGCSRADRHRDRRGVDHDAGQHHGPSTGRRRSAARVVDGGTGRLGGPAPGCRLHGCGARLRGVPAGLRPCHAPGLRRGCRPGPDQGSGARA